MSQATSLNLIATDGQATAAFDQPFQQIPAFPRQRVFQLPAGTYSCTAFGFQPMIHATAPTGSNGARQYPSAANDARMDEAPNHPTSIAAAIHDYLERRAVDGENATRVLVEKERLLRQLTRFLERVWAVEEGQIFVHQIGPRELNDFVKVLRNLPGKDRNGDGTATLSAPRTVEKKIRMIADFFNHCVDELEAVLRSPAAKLVKVANQLKKRADREGRRYEPFTARQIETMFSPEVYLEVMSVPDRFWVPILAVHLGVRAGDVVRAATDSVGFDEAAGCWYIDVEVAHAKNTNSVRRLAITDPLVELGFIKYVEHVRSLGADLLFPNRDYTSKTLTRDPSKRVTQAFAHLLDTCGIVDVNLVFHSFRHTVVTALSDANVNLSDAMQICGHEAQDLAIRRGMLSKNAARSVHMKRYMHPDKPRLQIASPLARQKAALEDALQLPLDYPRLRVAAEIVRSHLRRSPTGFSAGWPRQNRRYTQEQVMRLHVSSLGTVL